MTPTVNAGRRRDKFRLVFAGQFQSSRVTDDYFGGMGRFLAGGAGRSERFEFRIVGQVSKALQETARQHGVTLTTTGYLPHVHAVREMGEADVLLLPAPRGANAAWLMPAKVYEYVATGRPILIVGSEEALVSRLVTRLRAGAVTPCRVDAIAATLNELWTRWLEGIEPEPVDRRGRAPCDRRRRAGRLADLLDEVVHHPHCVTHGDRGAVARAPVIPRSAKHGPPPRVQPVRLIEEVVR
jgi:hypothetical protein